MSGAARSTDVVVVGAGLAGLRCAVDLTATGLDVVVVDAADEVGGRVRTDVVDGFLVDRGFQLLNPAYPAVRSGIDVEALDLRPFGAGVVARTETGTARLGHPLHAPALLPSTLAFAARHPSQVAALARWAAPLAPRPTDGDLAHRLERRSPQQSARTFGQALDAVGAAGDLRRVLERFLTGVVLDDRHSTPDDLVLLLVSSFVRGTPGLPRDGMRALPAQLAGRLREVRLSTAVMRVEASSGRVDTDDGALVGKAVVVAADPSARPGSRDCRSPRCAG